MAPRGRMHPYGRQPASGDQLIVTGLPPSLDEQKLRQFFAVYGTVEKCKLLPSKSQGSATALVRFKHAVEAESAKEKLHGTTAPGSSEKVIVKFSTGHEDQNGGGAAPQEETTSSAGGKGYGKAERQKRFGTGGGAAAAATAGKGHEDIEDSKAFEKRTGNTAFSIEELITGYENSGALPNSRARDRSCYVAGLPPDCDDLHLFQLFSPFGPITPKGITVMREANGSCKGFAFVNFLYVESAHYAIACYNGCELPDGSWLRVSIKRHVKGEKGEGKGDAKADAA